MGVSTPHWRAAIGCWMGSSMSVAASVATTSRPGQALVFYALVLAVLLVIGGVEMNPGPFDKCRCEMCGTLYETVVLEVKSREKAVEEQVKDLHQRERQMSGKEKMLEERENALAKNQKMLVKRESVLEKRGSFISERERAVMMMWSHVRDKAREKGIILQEAPGNSEQQGNAVSVEIKVSDLTSAQPQTMSIDFPERQLENTLHNHFQLPRLNMSNPYEPPRLDISNSYDTPRLNVSNLYEQPRGNMDNPYDPPRVNVSNPYDPPRLNMSNLYDPPRLNVSNLYEPPRGNMKNHYEPPRVNVSSPCEPLRGNVVSMEMQRSCSSSTRPWMLGACSMYPCVRFTQPQIPRADPPYPDEALLQAAKNGRVEAVQTLVQRGATLDLKDWDGWTALMWAARSGHMAVVKQLVWAGASLTVTNNEGQSVLDLTDDPAVLDFLYKSLF